MSDLVSVPIEATGEPNPPSAPVLEPPPLVSALDILPPDSYQPSIAEISPDLAEVARTELNELDDAGRRVAMWGLKRRCDTGSIKLPTHVIDEPSLLLAFLRVSKYDTERAWARLKRLSELRKLLKIDDDLSPHLLNEVLRSEMFLFPGTKDKAGNTVIIVRVSELDARRFPFITIQKALLLLMLLSLGDAEAQIRGYTVVLDFENVAFRNLVGSAGKASKAKLVVEMLQECVPARVKRVVFIREPWYIATVWAIVRPFLKQKMRDRVSMIHDPALLSEIIDAENLLQRYGGSHNYDWQSAARDMVEKDGGSWAVYETITLSVTDEAHYQTARLGIVVVSEERDCITLTVTEVRRGGIGERVGLRIGDHIWAVNGYNTYKATDISSGQRHRVGGGLDILIRRKLNPDMGLSEGEVYEKRAKREGVDKEDAQGKQPELVEKE